MSEVPARLCPLPEAFDRQAGRDGPVPLSRTALAHRLVLFGLALTLMWKCSYYAAVDAVYVDYPLRDSFFPWLLQVQWTLRIAFLSSVSLIAAAFVTSSRTIRVVCSWLLLIAVTVMCLHQGSYNDMTFATAWWTALWSLWFSHRMELDNDDRLLRRGAFLSRAILSMILLGGAVGKWTPEYWSGEVLHEIYFKDRDFWVFNLLRSWLDEPALRDLATWYSRKVVVVETVCGLGLWLCRPRIAAIVGVTVFSSIALLSNFLLFSVLSCLIALAAVGFLVPCRVANDHDNDKCNDSDAAVDPRT